LSDARSALARLIEASKPKPRMAAQTKSKVESAAKPPREVAARKDKDKDQDAAAPAPAAAENTTAEKPGKDIEETKTVTRNEPDAIEKPTRQGERKAVEPRGKDRAAEQARLQRAFEAAERHERLEKRRLAERRAERRRTYEPEPAVRYYRAGAPEPRRRGARFTDIWSD
jgi:hypothetical protein